MHVSGLTGLGLDSLIETISVVAELQDLRGEQEGPCQGYVLESKMQKGLGYVDMLSCIPCTSVKEIV